MDQISFNQEPEVEPVATGPTDMPAPPLTPEVAKRRATVAQKGVGNLVQQTYDDIYRQISEGNEQNIRDNAALAAMMERQQQKDKEIADASYRHVSLEEFMALQDKYKNMSPIEPSTIVEREYGKNYINNIPTTANRLQDTILDDASAQIPGELDRFFNQGSDLAAKREWWLKKAEDLQSEVDQQSWIGWGIDQAKQFIPFYNEVKNRGNNPSVGVFAGLTLGENLDEQGKAYFNMPLDEMSKMAEAKLNTFRDNPSLGAQYAQYMAGMSTSDKILNDVLTPLEIQGGYSLLKGAKGFIRTVDVYNRAQKVVKDAVKSTADKDITKASVAEALGDTGEAAVQTTLEAHINSLKGIDQTTKNDLLTLTSHVRADMDNIKANPGNLSREETTRLLDMYESYGRQLIDTLVNTTKVERVPWLQASEDGLRMLRDKAKEYFAGRDNTILDIDIRKDPLSGGLFRDMKLGNYDGSPFLSVEQAQAHADINGYGKIDVVGQAPDKVYFSPGMAKDLQNGTLEIKTTQGSTRFYRDGVEVVPTAEPTPNFIPYNLKTQKFEKALGENVIEQKGLGFYIRMSRPVNETEAWIRDGLIWNNKAKSSSSMTGWRAGANALLGRLRGASDTLSMQETIQRLKVVYSQNKFLELANAQMKYVEDVARGRIKEDPLTGKPLDLGGGKMSYFDGKKPSDKTRFEEFNRALQAARNLKDEKGLPGRWFKNPAELHNYYVTNFKRPPSFEETAAYFAFTRAYDYDLAMRNVRMFANKTRLGAESWAIVTAKDGKRLPSDRFDAVQRTKLPRTDDNLLIHDVTGKTTIANTESMDTKLRQRIESDMAEGKGRLVEVYDPESRPFDAFDSSGNKARIRYVYSNSLENAPLTYNQVGRREGGHFEYDYSHYIKQAKIRSELTGGKRRYWYEGDMTLMPVENLVMGKDIAKKFDTVRELLKANKNIEARDFAKANLDVPWKELRSWFKKSKDPITGQISPPRFNLNEPFQIVPNGRTLHEIDKKLSEKYETGPNKGTFINGTRHGSLARNYLVGYTQARDAYDMFTFKNVGNQYNPVYKYQPAEMIDPLPTLTRALDRITNSLFMDDYKIYAVEHWLQENSGLLAKSQGEIRGSPFYHFNEAANSSSWRKPTTESYPQYRNAWDNYLKIKELLGTPSVWQQNMQWIKQSLNDLAYEKLGPKSDKVMVVPDWMFDKAPNPLAAARGLAFHAKLGLFNISQLLTQSMNWVNIVALAPGHVTQGSFGALMHQWSRVKGDEQMLMAMDKWGEKFGWKPGQLREAMRTLDSTGFGVVGGEYALDQAMKHYYIRNGARQFLDLGQTFFKEAERNQRYAAWYTAFHEWRAANPLVTIKDKEIGEILARADDLTVNMSRASNSMLNKGIWSIPAQFLSYQYRLGELFWSKRIGATLAERTMKRAILYGTYAALYGMPGALGVSGLPIGDYIRKAAIDHGYNIGDDAIQSFFMEGGLSLIGALITGNGDFQAGNWYNWNDKVGANGFSPLREALRSDASLWKLLGGAAGSVIGNTLSASDGWRHAMMSMMSGNKDEEAFPMKLDDWLDLGNEVKSFDLGRRMIHAFNYGQWRTANEAYITDVSKANAVFMTLTGLQPQQLDDKYLKSWTKQDEDNAYKDALQKFSKNFRRAAQAAADGDPEQSKDYYTRAFNQLKFVGYPKENYAKAVQMASQGYESIIDKGDYSYYMNDVPEYRKQDAMDAYKTQLELNLKRNLP